MIIGLLGDFVLNSKHEAWIDEKLDSVIQRGRDKDATFIVMSGSGWDMMRKLSEVDHFVVSKWGGYEFPSALCTFHGDIEFFVDMSDLMVIISNNDVHTVWDYVRRQPVRRIEVNYLKKKEKLFN